MIDFTDAKSIQINGKDVKRLSIGNQIIWEKVLESIVLTTDKNILSYYDGDTATLTATVLDEDDNPIEGGLVEFFKDNVSIGTATTNSNGIATKTINSNNEGTVTFKAEYNSFTSNNITIIDTYYYRDCKTNDNNWTFPSESTHTFDANGLTATGTAKNVVFAQLGINYPSRYRVEAEIEKIVIAANVCAGLATEGVYIHSFSDKSQFTKISGGTYGTYPSKLKKGDIIKLVYDGTNVTAYVNNTLVGSGLKDDMQGVGIRLYQGRSITLKDLKIITLSTPNTIVLESDKSILSYTNSESANLTATVTDQYGEVMVGETVQLYDSSNALIGTMTDNNDGTYSYTYNSANNGEITLYAKIDNTTSNSINIKDILFYDPATALNVSRYTASAGTFTYDTNSGAYIYKNSTKNGIQKITINDVSFTNKIKIEYDFKILDDGNVQGGVGFGADSTIQCRFVRSSTTSGGTYLLRIHNGTSIVASTQYNWDKDWYHLTVEIENGIITGTVSRNNIDVASVNYTLVDTLDSSSISLRGGYDANKQIAYKNIIIEGT